MFDHFIYKLTVTFLAIILIAKLLVPAISYSKNIFEKSKNITINYDERFDIN